MYAVKFGYVTWTNAFSMTWSQITASIIAECMLELDDMIWLKSISLCVYLSV